MAGRPPLPAPWFPILSQPLGASGCPPGHTEPDQSSRNAGCPLQAPQPLPPPAPSLSQPPPTVMNSHLPLPPWEHGFRLHSLQLLWASPRGTGDAGAPPTSQAPLAARVLLAAFCSVPVPGGPGLGCGAQGQGQGGELGKTLSLLARTLLPPAARLGPQDIVQMALWAHRPRQALLPGTGGRHSRWVCGEMPVFPRDVIPASAGPFFGVGSNLTSSAHLQVPAGNPGPRATRSPQQSPCLH